ncbi:hypothetical protein V3C99_001251 [Haemonchus contortus]
MSEERRRSPPKKTFPFLRRGEGQKTKIEYPVLKRSSSKPRSEAHRNVDALHPSVEQHDADENEVRIGHIGGDQQRQHARLVADADYQTPSLPRTVRTADSGFHQEGENQANEYGSPSTSSSTSQGLSHTSSSIAQENIDLRKRRVLPIQEWARRKNYSFSGPAVASPSPMLASTPQPGSELNSPELPQPVPALETSILGDVTNVADSTESNEGNGNGRRQIPQPQENYMPRFVAQSNVPLHPRHEQIRKDHNIQHPLRTPFMTPSSDGTPPPETIRTTRDKPLYTDVERKLVEQLRNAIAHLDLADMEQRMRAKELERAYEKFRDDVREFEAEKETEKERMQRMRRQLEREKRIATKDGAERDKAVAEQVDELMKTISQKDQQISNLRVRLRKAEKQAESKEQELEESNKKVERLEKGCKALQRQLAQLRGNFAKQSQEMAAELQAARAHNARRRGTVGLLPTLHKQAANEERTVDHQVDMNKPRRPSQERYKSVSWADKTAPAAISESAPKKGSYLMELVEEGTAFFGPCRLFRNGIGDWTKVTTTECGCDLYEYSNSDIRWLSCDRVVEINYFGVIGATVITLVNGCSIRYFNTGQIELYRLSGEISRFDPVTKQRTETMLHGDRSRFVEMFDSSGSCLRIDGTNKSWQRFGERSTYRGLPTDRHVYNHSNVEPEWIEPEYNARRCPDGSLKVKFANVMVCCLGVEDVGYVKHTTRLENGSERKRMCVEWGHVARARQRQIEARKCQQMTALNATV